MIKIAMIDDHALLRNALAVIINSFKGYSVLLQANNGSHFIELLDPANLPDIVLLDVNMPIMNGFETAVWISDNHPGIKVIALSMISDERAIIKMLHSGAKGYLLKDTELDDLEAALQEVSEKGIYINDLLYRNIVHTINGKYLANMEEHEQRVAVSLTEREREFLRLLCTDKSYKEIAATMCLSPRTIDGYRDSLFEKLKAVSRVGLVLFAIRNEVAKL
jgi:DNA-binding NarL/FixJ family response regulator